MKRLLIVIIMLFPIVAFSQKIKVDEIDKFTKQRRIETTPAQLKAGLLEGIGIYIRSVDTTSFIMIRGYGAAADVIGPTDAAIFLLDNDSTVRIYPTGVQDYEIGTGANHNYYLHQYLSSLSDIIQLSNHNLKSIRKYGSDGYVDIDVPDKHQDELRKVCQLFLKTINVSTK